MFVTIGSISVSVNRNFSCFHKQMDGILACLQKPKLGTQMGPKGTLHGEWHKEKRNKNKAIAWNATIFSSNRAIWHTYHPKTPN
jgi:hypothetical protein